MTDPRVDEALRRAAELLALDAKRQMGPIQTKEARNLTGWAEAIRALRDMPCKCDESPSRVAVVGHNYDCPVELAKDAIASFIRAILGE